MRKGTHIIVAVLACCVVETTVLFVIPVRGRVAFGPRQFAAVLFGLLLIPFLASLFSRFIYGNRRWLIRTIGAIGLTTIAVIGFAALLMGEFEWFGALPYDPRQSLVPVWVVVDFILVTWVLWKLWHRSRRRSFEFEMEQWLSQRDSGIGREDKLRYNRAIRIALWLPVATVLLAFLFLPNSWALVSHVVHPTANHLVGYELKIPLSWVVLASEGDDFVYGVTATEMIRDPVRWTRYGDIPITRWSFSINPNWRKEFSQSQSLSNMVETRSFATSKGAITCSRYWPSRFGDPDPEYAFVNCSGPSGLMASMYGQSRDVSGFYAVIEKIGREN